MNLLKNAKKVLVLYEVSEILHHQSSFKVCSFGFYLHQENYEGGFPEIFQLKKSQIEGQTPSYILFGWQTDQNGVYTKVWIDMKLPEDAEYPCLVDRSWTIENIVNTKTQKVYSEVEQVHTNSL